MALLLTFCTCSSAGDWFIENVLEELDAPNEFYFSKAEQKLYHVRNGTGPPPATALYEVPLGLYPIVTLQYSSTTS